MECKKCKNKIKNNYEYCPFCGRKTNLSKDDKEYNDKIIKLLDILSVIFIFIIPLTYFCKSLLFFLTSVGIGFIIAIIRKSLFLGNKNIIFSIYLSFFIIFLYNSFVTFLVFYIPNIVLYFWIAVICIVVLFVLIWIGKILDR